METWESSQSTVVAYHAHLAVAAVGGYSRCPVQLGSVRNWSKESGYIGSGLSDRCRRHLAGADIEDSVASDTRPQVLMRQKVFVDLENAAVSLAAAVVRRIRVVLQTLSSC